MKETKLAVLLMAFAVVATTAIPVLGANNRVVKVNQIEGAGIKNSLLCPISLKFL